MCCLNQVQSIACLFLLSGAACEVSSSVCVCVCVCIHPQGYVLITGGIVSTSYNWLNNFCNFCMAGVVTIVSTVGVTLELKKPTYVQRVSYIALYNLLLSLKQLYVNYICNNKMVCFSYQGI